MKQNKVSTNKGYLATEFLPFKMNFSSRYTKSWIDLVYSFICIMKFPFHLSVPETKDFSFFLSFFFYLLSTTTVLLPKPCRISLNSVLIAFEQSVSVCNGE